MKKPYRYRTSEESREPGYLARRFKAYLRLQRMQAKKTEAVQSNVASLKRASK